MIKLNCNKASSTSKTASVNLFSSSITSLPSLAKLIKKPLTPLNSSFISVYCLTWNLAGNVPSFSDMEKVLPLNKSYDLYVINTQECERSVGGSFFNSSKDMWEMMLKKYFSATHENLVNSNLGSFHLAVYIKHGLIAHCSEIKNGYIKTGFMNLVANKGAIGTSFNFNGKSFFLICCHLAAGQNKVENRNNDFKRIKTNLNLVESSEDNAKLNSIKLSKSFKNIKSRSVNIGNSYIKHDKSGINYDFGSMDSYDFVIWSGDMNYRLNTKFSEEIERLLNEGNYEEVFKYDQLYNEKIKEKSGLSEFFEGSINFRPTYKFNIGTSDYNLSDRTPGWCDRILFKAKDVRNLTLVEYRSIEEVTLSDHKPVFAVFKAEIEEDEGSEGGFESLEDGCWIW